MTRVDGEVIQEWCGWVVEVGAGTFFARLVDVTAGDAEAAEEAEIPIASLQPRERRFLQPGAYLTMRVRRDPDGVDIRFSRRRWTQLELDKARREGERLAHAIGWSEP